MRGADYKACRVDKVEELLNAESNKENSTRGAHGYVRAWQPELRWADGLASRDAWTVIDTRQAVPRADAGAQHGKLRAMAFVAPWLPFTSGPRFFSQN